MDEVFLKINGKRHYLWRAVDQAGNVLDILVQSRRSQAAAKKVFRKLLPWRWSWLVPLLKIVFPSSSSLRCSRHSAFAGVAT